ncbi:MAG: HDOD domain-containing protein [Oligoflexales bacterium]
MGLHHTRSCTECGTEFNGREDYLLYGTRWRLSSNQILWFDCHCGNTLQLPAGEASWFSPSLFMSEETSKVYSSIGASLKLPRISPQILQLQQNIRNPNTDASHIAEILKKDPLISARVIQLANNLSPQASIQTLHHAIGYVGRDLLSEFITTSFLKQIPFNTQIYRPRQFWEESCLKAHITQRLMSEFGEDITQDPWLFGSLKDIGRLVGSVLIPDKIDEISSKIKDPKTQNRWDYIETSLGVPSQKALGEIGTIIWGLPELLKSALLFNPDFKRTHQKLNLEEAIAIANEAAYWLLLEPHRVNMQIMQWGLKRINMDEDHFIVWLKKNPNLITLSKEEALQATATS